MNGMLRTIRRELKTIDVSGARRAAAVRRFFSLLFVMFVSVLRPDSGTG